MSKSLKGCGGPDVQMQLQQQILTKAFPPHEHDHIKFGLIFFFSGFAANHQDLFRVKVGLVREVSELHVVPSKVNSKVIA